MRVHVAPTGQEKSFPKNALIVSKTDLMGRITYANRLFMEVAEFSEEELLGTPHNILRHPDMPHGAFKLAWETDEPTRMMGAFAQRRR